MRYPVALLTIGASLLMAGGCASSDRREARDDRDRHHDYRERREDRHDHDRRIEPQRPYGRNDRDNHDARRSDASLNKEKTLPKRECPCIARDRNFVTDTAQSNLTGIELGQLALTNASSPEVRTFGQQMIDYHTRAQAELLSAAQGTGLLVPQEMDDAHVELIGRLQDLHGTEFDREYVAVVIRDYGKVVQQFEKESRQGQPDDLRRYVASRSLPNLREQLRAAQDINEQMH